MTTSVGSATGPRSARAGGASACHAPLLDAVDRAALLVLLGFHLQAEPLLDRAGNRAAHRVLLPVKLLGSLVDAHAARGAHRGDEAGLLGVGARRDRLRLRLALGVRLRRLFG